MKRYRYIGLLLFAGLVAACQKETAKPVGTGYSTEAILFTTPYTVSKSAAMRNGDFNVDDEIGVLGYSEVIYEANGVRVNASTADWNDKKEFATPDVFYNQKLVYAGNGTLDYTWTGRDAVGNLHPWYNEADADPSVDGEYTYAFFAYYPYADVNEYNYEGTIGERNNSKGTIKLSGKNAKGDPTITYTMPYNKDSNISTRLDWTRVPDFMLACNVNHVHSDGAVPLKFRHMLCAFEFEINNYRTEDVTINSLKFTGEDFYRSFTISGQNTNYATPNDDRYSGFFELITEDLVCPAAEADENGIVNEPTKTFITEDGTSNGVRIDLLFIPGTDNKITAGDCSVTLSINETERPAQNIKDGMKFYPGTKSIFSINIIGDDIVIQVRTQDNWDNGGDSNIYFD